MASAGIPPANDDERAVLSGVAVTPEAVANRTFTSAFRGFDHTEVRSYLKRVSEELAAAAEREAHLRQELNDAQTRAAHPELDENLLTTALGEHAARLLSSAREQAAAMKAEAEEKAAKLMREAETKISRIRAEADSLLARRVEEVDGVSANLRNAAEADAKALREQAKADAENELASARAQGREMVAEARAMRERILADLARRRHIAEVQLDQLRAARERLLDAYSLVRRTLDEATQELKMAEIEARLAADEVGRRAPDPPPKPSSPVSALAGSPRDGNGTGGGLRAAPAGAATAASATVTAPPRSPRTEPAGRPEARLRPPGHPGRESRPPQPGPARRPADSEPVPGGTRVAGGQTPVVSQPGPTGPPGPVGPSRMPSPIVRRGAREVDEQPARPQSLTKASSPAPPPLAPPSILPRPVPPPPARGGATPPATGDLQPGPPKPAPEVDRVDALFARIKADRAATAAAAARAAAPDTVPSPAEPPVTPLAGAESGTDAGAAPPEVVEAADATASSGPPPATDVVSESARSRRDEVLEPLEETLARQLKRILQDEQNEVLDRLRRRRWRNHGPLPDADEQVGRYREAAESALADAVRAGIRFADANASEAHADEHAARELATALARQVAEPLRQRLSRALDDGGEGDAGVEAAEVVSGVYRQWRSQEIEPLARHHAVVAFSRGAYAGFAEGASLRWVVDDDGGPCPDCDDNTLAGEVIKGDAFPTGQLHPPAHPGCRCVLIPADR